MSRRHSNILAYTGNTNIILFGSYILSTSKHEPISRIQVRLKSESLMPIFKTFERIDAGIFIGVYCNFMRKSRIFGNSVAVCSLRFFLIRLPCSQHFLFWLCTFQFRYAHHLFDASNISYISGFINELHIWMLTSYK